MADEVYAEPLSDLPTLWWLITAGVSGAFAWAEWKKNNTEVWPERKYPERPAEDIKAFFEKYRITNVTVTVLNGPSNLSKDNLLSVSLYADKSRVVAFASLETPYCVPQTDKGKTQARAGAMVLENTEDDGERKTQPIAQAYPPIDRTAARERR